MFTMDQIQHGLAWFQLAFGLLFAVSGFRTYRDTRKPLPVRWSTRYFAPLGLFFMLQGLLKLTDHRFDEGTMIVLALLGFTPLAVWWFRIHRSVIAEAKSPLTGVGARRTPSARSDS